MKKKNFLFLIPSFSHNIADLKFYFKITGNDVAINNKRQLVEGNSHVDDNDSDCSFISENHTPDG